MDNQVKLVQFTAKSFAGIDKSAPVVIVFPQGYGGYVALQGDQQTRKTSTIEAFKVACGIEGPKNAMNRKDNDRRVQFEFEKGDKKYKVSISKTRFEAELLVDPDNLKWAKLSSPQTLVKELLPVGLSPMSLKQDSGKAQVEWLKSFFNQDPDAKILADEIETNIKKTYKARRDAGRDFKKVNMLLNANPYFKDREQWQKKLAEGKENASEDKIKDVQKRYNLYTRAVAEIETQKTKKADLVVDALTIDNEIAELERQLEAKKQAKQAILKEVEEIDGRLTKGEAWVEENKGVEKENENISNLIKQQQEFERDRLGFSQMVEIENQKNHLSDEYVRLQNRYDAYLKTKRELIQAYTPDIEGLEVCVPDNGEVDEDETDADKKSETREGLFYNGCSLLELSESELWGLYAQLLEKLNIKIILVENITSLGSSAIELFENFIAAGGYVLASEMKRNEKSLKVIVQNKIIEDLEEVENE